MDDTITIPLHEYKRLVDIAIENTGEAMAHMGSYLAGKYSLAGDRRFAVDMQQYLPEDMRDYEEES